MAFTIDRIWLLSVLLVSIRLGWFFFSTPLGLLGFLPTRIKLYMVVVLSAVLVSFMDVTPLNMPQNVIELALMGLNELVLGFVLVLGLYLAFAAFNVGGRILDFQSGFASANLFNPGTNSQEPLLGTVITLTAAVWFFWAGGHHYILKMLAVSLQVVPIGQPIGDLFLPSIVKQLGVMFGYALVLISPVLVVLFLMDTSIAVMSRSMPQMNVYFLFLPLKLGVSLVLTGMTLRYMTPVLERLMLKVLQYWNEVLVLSS